MEEPIDLNKLTPRQLLILVARDVNELKEEMKGVKKDYHAIDKKVSNLETKNRVWASVVAFFTTIGAIFLERQLK